jgi:hypothetical protein
MTSRRLRPQPTNHWPNLRAAKFRLLTGCFPEPGHSSIADLPARIARQACPSHEHEPAALLQGKVEDANPFKAFALEESTAC